MALAQSGMVGGALGEEVEMEVEVEGKGAALFLYEPPPRDHAEDDDDDDNDDALASLPILPQRILAPPTLSTPVSMLLVVVVVVVVDCVDLLSLEGAASLLPMLLFRLLSSPSSPLLQLASWV